MSQSETGDKSWMMNPAGSLKMTESTKRRFSVPTGAMQERGNIPAIIVVKHSPSVCLPSALSWGGQEKNMRMGEAITDLIARIPVILACDDV